MAFCCSTAEASTRSEALNISAEAALAASAFCSTVTAHRTTRVAIPQAAITAAKDSINFLGTDRFCSIFYARGEDYSLSLAARCSPKP
ncbi:hypothetical protein D3C81_1905340 [compost metagenome]